jgi:hypothetical protein
MLNIATQINVGPDTNIISQRLRNYILEVVNQ